MPSVAPKPSVARSRSSLRTSSSCQSAVPGFGSDSVSDVGLNVVKMFRAAGQLVAFTVQRQFQPGAEERMQSAAAVRETAEVSRQTQRGNCTELACVCAVELEERGAVGVEIMGIPGNHAFCVLGRSPNSLVTERDVLINRSSLHTRINK